MQLQPDRRERFWNEAARETWDLIIVGGGITGAGLLRDAARCGLRVLLLEQNDFASGTSSRSSKLVHGGLRYLKTGQWRLTLESVRERERLLREGAGLVEPLGFVLPVYAGQRPPPALLRAGLVAYDLMSGRLQHRFLDGPELALTAPHLREQGLAGAFVYPDAQTDDARLVLRQIQEALAGNPQAAALNYARVEELLRVNGRVGGVRLRDQAGPGRAELRARVVINAGGAWADRLRTQLGNAAKLRPLRGSHLVFPYHCLPVAQAVSLFHPEDRRPVFVFPWEGAVIVGTTDLDHREDLDLEPRISAGEIAYLMRALRHQFPALALRPEQAVASYAGVRPVVASGQADPSKESRDHVLWHEDGLVTVTGGKLTTFRTTAREALHSLRRELPALGQLQADDPVFDAVPPPRSVPGLGAATLRRLYGRYGQLADRLLSEARPEELTPVAGSVYLWAELRWAAAHEAVLHLSDLLLRRTRIGLVVAQGGLAQLPDIRALCQPLLGWDDGRWADEESAYRRLWTTYHAVPAGEGA